MIESMTGYGKASITFQDKKICVEIKSLNSKNLDIVMRTASPYREKEIEIRQTIATALERGKVDVSIWNETIGDTPLLPIDIDLLTNYYQQLKEILSNSGISEPQDWLSLLLRIPEVVSRKDNDTLSEAEWMITKETISQAIENVVEFRRQEGFSLEKVLNEKADNIEALMYNLEKYESERIEKVKARIIEAMGALKDIKYDRDRFEQELIYYIEKLDISEEKQRLTNHIEYFRKTIKEGKAQGKKLAFIAQEMGREINTTGSKSNHAEMQNIVVRMKDELEQIKEQVLNVL